MIPSPELLKSLYEYIEKHQGIVGLPNYLLRGVLDWAQETVVGKHSGTRKIFANEVPQYTNLKLPHGRWVEFYNGQMFEITGIDPVTYREVNPLTKEPL